MSPEAPSGALTRNGEFALFYAARRGGHGESWLVRLVDLKAVRIGIGGGTLSPDGTKVCTSTGGSRLFWWRLDPDEMMYRLIPNIYVIDISGAYADLDGPKAFAVQDRLRGEWHPLGEDAKE